MVIYIMYKGKEHSIMKTVFVGIVCLFIASSLFGQAPKTPEPAKTSKKGPAAVEFQQVLVKWKTLIGELGNLQTRYRDANEADRKKLEKQWEEVVAEGMEMEPQLISAAEKAFVESPRADKQITEFLNTAMATRFDYDDYETVLRIGKLLIDNRANDRRAAALTGVSAAVLGDFDAAKKYFDLANADGVFGDQTAPVELVKRVKLYSENLKPMKKLWEAEKKIREKEDQAGDLPRVLIKTNRGNMEAVLFENEAPNTVANFITLAEKGKYNQLTFHRVIAQFMAQGGDPKGDGTGGPGYNIPFEADRPGYRLHFRGYLSMARSEGLNTAGQQFFICFTPGFPEWPINDKYTVFGRVTKGLDVLAKIQRRDLDKNPNAADPDKILEIKVLKKRDHEYKVKKAGS
jgi:cyclophilin family peptidyl-prolyl cis-trans isomerase